MERPRIARSVWIALVICAAFRLAIEPLHDLPKADRNEDLYDFLVAERFFIEEPRELPQVVLLGSSISMYNFVPDLLAAELGLAESRVRLLAFPAGAPWDAAALLRRNPELLHEAQVVLFDVQPYMFNTSYEHAVPSRFYNLATLAEATQLAGLASLRAVGNWVWPFVSFRRPLRAWVMQVDHWISGSTPLEKATAYPDWHPEAKYYKPTEAELFRALSTPKFQPREWADVTIGDWSFSRRQAESLLAMVRELRERGIHVFIHQPPFHPDFYARARERDETRRGLERYFSFLDELEAAGAHVEIWMEPKDLGFLPADLPDYGHLTRRLAELYTRAVATRLQDLDMVPNGPPPPAP